MQISDEVLSFSADVVGVLLGAFLGYLLGLRQQRKIDYERDAKRKQELKVALKDELEYLAKEVTRQSEATLEFFRSFGFDTVFLDMPTFTSIVNSGQLLLLDSEVVHSLRELNTQIHEHNISQTVLEAFIGVSNSSRLVAPTEEFKKIVLDPVEHSSSRITELLKLVMDKRKIIAQECEDLIQKLR